MPPPQAFVQYHRSRTAVCVEGHLGPCASAGWGPVCPCRRRMRAHMRGSPRRLYCARWKQGV